VLQLVTESSALVPPMLVGRAWLAASSSAAPPPPQALGSERVATATAETGILPRGLERGIGSRPVESAL